MEAKSLRIGNLIQVLDIETNLWVIDVVYRLDGYNNWIYTKDEIEGGAEANEEIKPIPLTEEWLVKANFGNWGIVKVNEYESYQRWVLHNAIEGTSNYEVHIITSTYANTNDVEICYSIDNDERQTIKQTEFVHNLQNAFYLASGYELTIK